MIEQTKEGVLSAADLAETEERKTQSIGGPKGTAMAREDERAPLFVAGEAQDFRSKWERIQTGFVRNYALAFLLGAVAILVYVGARS